MGLRGNWGSAEGVEPNSHGNFKKLVPVIRILEDLRRGRTVNQASLKMVQKVYPEYFDGNSPSPQGLEVLEKVIGILPCIVSKDGLEYLRRRT